MKRIAFPLLSFFLIMLVCSTNAQSLEWAGQLGGNGSDQPKSIVVNMDGSVVSTGYFILTTDFDPGAGIFNLTSTGTYNAYISKLDGGGNFIWAKQFTGNTTYGHSIAIDSDGNMIITGSFRGTADFDPGPGTFNLNAPSNYDIFITKLDSGGNFLWAKQIIGPDLDQGNAVITDPNNNIFITGYFRDTCDFDPGSGTVFLNSTDNTNEAFILKLDSGGNFIWANHFGGKSLDEGTGLAIDGAGSLYAMGAFSDTSIFYTASSIDTLISSGIIDIYIAKFNNTGVLMWLNQLGGAGLDEGHSIAVDQMANIYTTGYFNNTADFDPGSGIYSLTSSGSAEVFVSKIDSAGNFIWAKQIGGVSNEDCHSLALDANSNVYLTGNFDGTADFDPGISNFNMTSIASNDIFITKLDTDGNFTWARQLGGSLNDYGRGIAVDSFTNVFVTGTFMNTVDFDPDSGIYNLTTAGSNDVFILKLSDNTTGITEGFSMNSIASAYPNPFEDHFSIFNLEALKNISSIQLSDLYGKHVKCNPVVDFSSNSIHIDNLSNLSKGIYFLNISNKYNQINLKLIKN